MKLSVLIITYNHEKYIAQALDSVIMQQVDFMYEIVVGEDCSTDATRQILISYKNKFPNKIKLLLPEKNIGMLPNFVSTLNACTGKFISLLEGDDYWISSDKLKLQVDFLDNHPECAICFHNCEEFYEDGRKPSWNYCSDEQKAISTLEDLIDKCNFMPTCSVVFRNNMFEKLPDWFYSLGMGDWPLHILNAQHGDIGYIDEVMSRHRHHDGGVWSLRNQVNNILDVVHAYEVVDKHLCYRYKTIVSEKISAFYYEVSQIWASDDITAGLKYLAKSFARSPHKLKMLPKLLITSSRMAISRLRINR